MTSMSATTAWTEEDFEKKAFRSALRRVYSKLRTEAFFAKRDHVSKSIGWLRIMLAKLEHEGPEPVWDKMREDYDRIIREYDEQVARIHFKAREAIQEGEDTLDFIARGEVA